MDNFGFSETSLINNGLTYRGAWNALLNSPTLTSGVGTAGDYYIVSVAGTTNLDGVNDWQVGDWAIFEGATNMWQKIDNHDVQAYSFVQNQSVALPQRTTIDFQGLGVQVTDNGTKTIVTIAGNIPTTNYGLYSQTANSIPVTATTVEGSLVGAGVGTLSIPANTFSVGESFRADFGGLISTKNNDTLRIRVKTVGGIILADSGFQDMPLITNNIWQLSINFTIRAIGAAGVASIVSLGVFHDVKTANGVQSGFAFSTVNNTTFDTTIPNTLVVTAEWSSNSALNNIYSNIFVLNKIY